MINYFWFYFLIFYLEALFAFLSRNSSYEPLFTRDDLGADHFVFLVFIFVLVIALSLLTGFLKEVKTKYFKLNYNYFLIITIVLNLIAALTLDAEFRYAEVKRLDALIYVFATSMSTLAVVFFIKDRPGVSYKLAIIFILSVALRLDGLSSCITLVCYVFIFNYYVFKISNLALSITVLFLLPQIFHLKGDGFGSLPLSEIYGWAVWRFSIPFETTISYISGSHYLKDFHDLFEILKVAFLCRVEFLDAGSACAGIVKSVGNANYLTLYGTTKGGSSPGPIGGIAMLNVFSICFLLPFVFIVSRLQLDKEKFLILLCIAYLFKWPISNMPDMVSLISVNLFLFVFYFILLSFFKTVRS